MGSPFPGMDPYLEGEMWQEFHDRLANQISAQLMPRVGPRYAALLGKRYVPEPRAAPAEQPGLGNAPARPLADCARAAHRAGP
jgi:hypothetical protein